MALYFISNYMRFGAWLSLPSRITGTQFRTKFPLAQLRLISLTEKSFNWAARVRSAPAGTPAPASAAGLWARARAPVPAPAYLSWVLVWPCEYMTKKRPKQTSSNYVSPTVVVLFQTIDLRLEFIGFMRNCAIGTPISKFKNIQGRKISPTVIIQIVAKQPVFAAKLSRSFLAPS